MDIIFRFLDRYFLPIMTINAFLLSGGVLLVIMLQARLLRMKHLRKIFNKMLFYIVFSGEVALVALMVFIFADNFRVKKPLDFSARVRGTTEWVKDPLQIYFISSQDLVCISANGTERQVVFHADAPIRSYHFSPDGRYLALATLDDLFLLDREKEYSRQVDTWRVAETSDVKYKGSINGIAWSPLSERFCYRLARWTQFSNQENYYIYEVKSGEKKAIQSPTRKLHSLSWDESGTALYYAWFDALDKTVSGNPFEVKVFQVPLDTLIPYMVLKFPFDQPTLSPEHLAVKGIKIFIPPFKLSFGQEEDYGNNWVSEKGPRLMIDAQDQLTYVKNRWWQRRLFRVPRVSSQGGIFAKSDPHGLLAIQYLRWFPSARYAIMEHSLFGLLILEPATGKIGILVNENGRGFGWYPR